jgi:hypothetical protein
LPIGACNSILGSTMSAELAMWVSGVATAAFTALTAVLARAQERRLKALEELAAKLGLQSTRDGGEIQLEGELDQRYRVIVAETVDRTGSTAIVKCSASIDAPFPFPVRMHVSTRDWASGPMRRTQRRVPTGDPDLDRDFTVFSPEPEAARSAMLGALGRALSSVEVKHHDQWLEGRRWAITLNQAALTPAWAEAALAQGLEVVRVAEGENVRKPRGATLHDELAPFEAFAESHGLEFSLEPFVLAGRYQDFDLAITHEAGRRLRFRIRFPRPLPKPLLVVAERRRGQVPFPCPELINPTGDPAFDETFVVCAEHRSFVEQILDETTRAELIKQAKQRELLVDAKGIETNALLGGPDLLPSQLAEPMELARLLWSRIELRGYRGSMLRQ